MASFTDRMIGASKLDVHTYEEVEVDTTALSQAMGVVVLSSVATGIGFASQQGAPGPLITAVITALFGWLFWAWLTYFVVHASYPHHKHTPIGASCCGRRVLLLLQECFVFSPLCLR